jgi:hypothetical protein
MLLIMAPKERLSAESRLILVRAKVERAKENLREMEQIVYAAHGIIPGRKMRVKSKKRPPGQIHVYTVPFSALTAAGDVVNNLRGALDHLLCQITMARRPRVTQKELRRVAFPICEDLDGYEKARKTCVQFIGPDAMKVIDALKPYKGGNEALWRLNEINNTAKHRLLLTVEKIVICHADWIAEGPAGNFMYNFRRPQFSGVYARPRADDYILVSGKETLSKLRASRREALLPTLHCLVGAVDNLLSLFLPFLK